MGIMAKVVVIIFLITFTDFLGFCFEHGIDLLDMLLHLGSHPLELSDK